MLFARGSPVSDDGRGLKHIAAAMPDMEWVGSPVSDDGRGLKQPVAQAGQRGPLGSPVSDDGRGLKQSVGYHVQLTVSVRPSVMTGVD